MRRLGGVALAVVVVVVAVAAAAACSGSHRSAASVTTRPTSTATRPGPTRPSSVPPISVPPSTRATATTVAESVSATPCVHLPTARVHDSYTGLPRPSGPSIDFATAHSYLPIVEGGDQIRYDDLAVQIVRPAGTVTLTHGDSRDTVVFRGSGDFDGDGRGDFLVDLYEQGNDAATEIVSGTIVAGTYDPAAVGVRVPRPAVAAGGFGPFAASVGDQNHDGADDVSFGAALYSGRQLASGPLDALPPPLRTLVAPYVGLLRVDVAGPPVLVVPVGSALVLDGRRDRLDFGADAPALAGAVAQGGHATGWLVDGHRLVEFAFTTRSGTTAWRFDLDGTCGS